LNITFLLLHISSVSHQSQLKETAAYKCRYVKTTLSHWWSGNTLTAATWVWYWALACEMVICSL